MKTVAAIYRKSEYSHRQTEAELLEVHELDEALKFLSARPLQTVIMAGWLRERGVRNAAHRGDFYRCRDSAGNISGIGLAGRNTFFEASSYDAIRAFAQVVRARSDVKMVFAEVDKFYEFWHEYTGSTKLPRLATTELLFETSDPLPIDEPVKELRPATPNDIAQVSRAHAAMVFDETGLDPLAVDRDGFTARCSERIALGRVWVWVKDGELIFKCDVVSETLDAIYVEGIWVAPSVRGKGVGRRALSALCSTLLNGSNSICGFVNSANSRAQALYWKTGFNLCGRYKKLYL